MSSLALVPFTADGVLLGGIAVLGHVPGSMDTPFLRLVNSVAAQLANGLLLAGALRDLRADNAIIEDVMPRQVGAARMHCL